MQKQITDTYHLIAAYPKTTAPITTVSNFLVTNTNITRKKTTFHDLIYNNVNALVPNIDMGYHLKQYNATELELWVNQTSEYMNLVNADFQEKCNKQMYKLKLIEEQKQKSAQLDMEKLIASLPEDMIRVIYTYLLPETRIELLLAKYPLYMDSLKKLSVKNIIRLTDKTNHLISNVMKKYQLFGILSNREIFQHPVTITMRRGYQNKSKSIGHIDWIIMTLKNAIPITPESYHFIQMTTLFLIRQIIYLGYYRKKNNHLSHKKSKPARTRTANANANANTNTNTTTNTTTPP